MKNRFTQIILFTLIVGFTNICQAKIERETLIRNLEDYIEFHNIPGISVSIVKSDSIIFVGGIGYSNVEKNEKITKEHLFRQGSISKSFTALGLYKLLKDSPYKLNSKLETIDKSLPFYNKWEKKEPVRVSHILEHTSGFEDFHLHAIYNTKDSIMPPVINMVNDHSKSLNSRWEPGTKKAYSNPNYIVAGHLIEKISGNSYNNYIYENILEPIGMKSSGYHFTQPKNKLFAQGYQRVGSTLNPISFTKINGGPAGGFCSNAEDMATYLQFMLKRDTLLFTEKEFDRIEFPQTSIVAKKGMQFGYGLGNYTIWKNGYLFHGHGGQIEGFTSRYMYSRDADLGIAISINRNGNANEIVGEILNYIIDKEKNSSIDRNIQPIPTSLKEKFSGFYEFKSPKSNLIAFTDRMLAGITLDFQENKIITKALLGKPKDTLYYAGNNQFYLNNESVPSVMLIDSKSDKEVLWINDNYTEKESRLKRLVIFFGLLISILLLTSYFIYTTVWLIKWLFTKEKKSPINHLVFFGMGISLVLLFLGFGLTLENIKTLGSINFYSILMYMSSFVVVVMSLLSVWRCFRLPKKKFFRVFYILTSISAVVITVYLMNIGLIGLKLWSY